jgi:hypothetical protein
VVKCLHGACGVGAGQEEWARDSKGSPAMTLPVFYNAVFEMLGVCLVSAPVPPCCIH